VRRTMSLVGTDETRRFPQAAAINARVDRKTGEHWRQLTSEVFETQSARRSKPGKPNKTGGLYRFLLRAMKRSSKAVTVPALT
jgi:hypothetical protein